VQKAKPPRTALDEMARKRTVHSEFCIRIHNLPGPQGIREGARSDWMRSDGDFGRDEMQGVFTVFIAMRNALLERWGEEDMSLDFTIFRDLKLTKLEEELL